ncbi:MAG: GTPase [Planctomycetota bacterium]|nr:GTPase [Planctomycetota bacterium]
MATDACRAPFCVETTAPGRGAISVIEVVGAAGWSRVKKLIPDRNFARCPRIALVDLVGHAGPIDQAIVAHVPASKSFTGHDTVEINIHGGPACVGRLVDALRRLGVPLRGRREPALLALKSGRLDLIQVEALDLLYEATTFRAASFLMRQFKGALSAAVNRILRRLELASVAAGCASRRTVSRRCAAILRSISRLRATADLGLALAEPARCVIAGEPNVGKSSLFNALLAVPRAIVDPEAGTTRDHVQEIASRQGIPFMLIDTAGVASMGEDRRGAAPVDDAIRRAAEADSLEQIRKARVSLFVVDARVCAAHADATVPQSVVRHVNAKRSVVVVNKIDLLNAQQREVIAESRLPHPAQPQVMVSALTGEGLDQLRSAIVTALVPASPPVPDAGAGVFTARQVRILLHLEEAARDAAAAAGLQAGGTRPELRRAIVLARSMILGKAH